MPVPKKTIILLCLFLTGSFLKSQTSRAIVPIDITGSQASRRSPAYEIPLDRVQPFLAYFIHWEGPVRQLRIRFSRDQQNWTSWHTVERDEHTPELSISQLGFTDPDLRFFQLDITGAGNEPSRILAHFFNPGITTLSPESDGPTFSSGRSCSNLTPPVITRSEWCPNGSCAEHPDPVFADVTHLVIHHSAGGNQSDDWPAVVRSIWDFHVNGRGWSDIGYNWLIDPEGKVYQGRTDDAVGAHYCGANTGTVGICMLGNFTEVSPTEMALYALREVLAWKSCEYNIAPLAEAYHASSDRIQPTIIGHRDGCATACPGDLLYPLIPALRAEVEGDQTTAVPSTQPDTSFHLYPNPGSGPFTVFSNLESPLELSLTLYNMQGQRVLESRSVTADRPLYLSPQLSPGAYLLVLRSGARIIGKERLILY